MRNMIDILLAVLLLCPFYSCDDVKEYPWNDAWDQTEQETPVEPEEPETPVEPETPQQPGEPLTLDWTDVSESFGILPTYITVKKSTSTISGKKTLIYVAEADLAQAQWDVWSVKIKENDGNLTEATDDSYKTPSQVYTDGSWPVVINGGYFYSEGGKNYTASLAVSNFEALAYNIGYEYDDAGKMLYPTRAVFCQTQDGEYDACWTYTIWDRTTYVYSSPSKDQTKVPTATYPSSTDEFKIQTAIGGGPVLIDNGKYANTYKEEYFYGIGPESSQPRTAIGVTADSKMMFFVCEGREMTSGVVGLTTAEVAGVLMGLGCVEAINLDGGGSSCMLVNGKETIKVSDGSQRAVASTVMLK